MSTIAALEKKTALQYTGVPAAHLGSTLAINYAMTAMVELMHRIQDPHRVKSAQQGSILLPDLHRAQFAHQGRIRALNPHRA